MVHQLFEEYIITVCVVEKAMHAYALCNTYYSGRRLYQYNKDDY